MKTEISTSDQLHADKEFPAAIRDQAAAWKARADANLSPTEEAQLRVWLDADPRHRAALKRFDRVWGKFDGPFQAGAADALLQALAVRSRHRRHRFAAAVAGVLVVLVVASMWRFAGNERPSGAVLAARQVAVATEASTASALLLRPARQVLPDGSVAELKSGAEIAVEYSPEVRRVVLRRGEVHFQVTKDVQRPFVVASGGVETRAVGTAFFVLLSPTAVEVLVNEGRVSVNQAVELPPAAAAPATRGESAPKSLAVLDAGKRMVVDRVSASAMQPQITSVLSDELDEHLAWRAPRAEFTRATLAEAVAVLNGYAATRLAAGQDCAQFIIENPTLAEIRVSGLFRVDRPTAFMGLLKSGFGIEAEPRADGKFVLRLAR